MESHLRMVLLVLFVLVLGISTRTVYAAVSQNTLKKIDTVNRKGPYLGIIVPNFFELSPLLQSTSFVADQKLPHLEFSGTYINFPSLTQFWYDINQKFYTEFYRKKVSIWTIG